MKKKGKEEAERHERIIRGLLKLTENRRCINCNSLGPQYVCTTFWTFVCTTCSGVHREFTHRVKSVSMAKFNDEEVSCLQAGGNERARQVYFKEWDPNRNSYPDGSNVHKLRDFIKHVYVDRRYSGQTTNTLTRLRLSDKDESLENGRGSSHRGGLRSPSSEDRNERPGSSGRSSHDKSFRYYYEERRSPRYAQDSPHGAPKRAPIRLEIVDDRFRDDDGQRGRHSNSHRHSLGGGSKFGNVSPERQQHNRTQSSSPVVRSVKDLLGENAPRLQIGERSKATSGKDAEGSAHHNKSASSANVASSGGNPVQEKSPPSQSLIDIDNDSKPADAASQPQTKENPTSSSVGNSSQAASQPKTQENHPSSSGGNNSSHESSAEKTAPVPAKPKPNTLEFLLFELGPSIVPANNAPEVPSNSIPPPTTSGGNMVMNTNASSTDGAGTVELSLFDSNAMATPASTSGGPPQVAPGVGENSNVKVSAPPAGGTLSLFDSNVPATSAPTSGGPPKAAPNSNVKVSAPPAGGSLSLFDLDVTATPAPTSGGPPQVAPAVVDNSNAKVSAPPSAGTVSLLDFNAPETPAPTSGGPPQVAPGVGDHSTVKVSNIQQVSTPQYQPAAIPATGGNSSGQHNITNSEMRNAPNVANAQGTSTATVENPSQNALKPAQDSHSGVASPQLAGRSELPSDLFTTRYTQAPGPFVGWQAVQQQYGMGYGMQQYHPMPVPAYRNPAPPTNPFEISSETTSFQEPPFPSMGNLRGAVPLMSAPGALSRASSFGNNNPSGMVAANMGVLTRRPSFGNNPPGMVETGSPYASAGVLTRRPSFGNNPPGMVIETGSPYSSARHHPPLPHPFPANTPGTTYMGQEHMNMSPYNNRPQGPYAVAQPPPYMNQHPTSGYSPTSQNTSFHPNNSGNPFG